jgi:hypothetical protein
MVKFTFCEKMVGEKVWARMTYMMRPAPLGVKVITLPLLTSCPGTWLAPSIAKNINQRDEQKDLLNELIDQLPTHDYFVQSCHYSLKKWLPFYWRNFKATLGYTYVFEEVNLSIAAHGDLL